MADRNEEQRSPEDARLIKRTSRAYFIQKNLPEAFPDWVGELESEMVEALGRASQTMDPCAFLEAFRDLLRKHRTSNWPVLLFSETLTSLFRRLAVKVVLEAHLSSVKSRILCRGP
jgi:phosphoserine phosphatase